MASNEKEQHHAPTKSTQETITEKPGEAGTAVDDKPATRTDTVPGWTIMKPLRMRGLKGKSSTNASVADDGIKSAANGKHNGDLKITETNDTTNGSNVVGDLEALHDVRSDEELLGNGEAGRPAGRDATGHQNNTGDGSGDVERASSEGPFKVYKRRWFGVAQLVLLNIVVSWDWLSFSANSTTASQYYDVTPTAINWISTGFLFAFVVASPAVMYVLHRGGPKPSIVTASVLLLLGNWIRYGATRAGPHGNFGGVMFGQILTGLAQPFVLAAPTRYSDLWFSNRGRIGATALMSLANPFGGALAQLIDPELADTPGDIPNMVLYISIIATVACVPSFFIPAKPPTPCSASSSTPKQALLPSVKFLFALPEFYFIMIPYIFYVGLFNSISSLINQMLQPYSFSETEAGIAGAILIVVGLIAAAVISPVIDRTKSYLIAIKVQVPVIAICYLAFTFAPQTRSVAAPFVILGVLGAASFSLLPVVLEYIIELTHPVSPEVTSTILWTGGQLLGGIFIIASGELRQAGPTDGSGDDGSDRPPGNMYKALILQTVLALVVVPLPLALGCCGREKQVVMKRLEADRTALARGNVTEEGGVTLP